MCGELRPAAPGKISERDMPLSVFHKAVADNRFQENRFQLGGCVKDRVTARSVTEAGRHAAHGKWLEVASGEPLRMRTQCGESVGARELGCQSAVVAARRYGD